MNHCDFHYSHLLPKKPGILPLEETMTKKCRRCGAEFITRSRIRKRCDTCQTQVSAEKQKKANERLKARRAARRVCATAGQACVRVLLPEASRILACWWVWWGRRFRLPSRTGPLP